MNRIALVLLCLALPAYATQTFNCSTTSVEAGAPSVPGEPLKPVPQCQVVISYPPGRPDLTTITFPGDDCYNQEVAVAEALAALLRAEMPATPKPK